MSEQSPILLKLNEIGERITRIETALYPDEGQPSRLTELEHRTATLEGWRNYTMGALAVLGAGLGTAARKLWWGH